MASPGLDSSRTAVLYVVSTPIGNLDDMSFRAVDILKQVDLIAAEDKRHSARLLNHYAIETTLCTYHDHSDEQSQKKIVDALLAGRSVALISDAGTPLIADPGFKLVRAVRQAGITIVPIPGPSAFVAALSVSGIPTDRFTFEGFLPAKTEQRRRRLQLIAKEERTLIFYEAPHRLLDTLLAMMAVFGDERQAVLGRELTKRFETIVHGTLSNLSEFVEADGNQQRGECVLVIHGFSRQVESSEAEREAERIIGLIKQDLTPKQTAAVAAKLAGVPKKLAYNLVLANKESS